MGTIRGYDEGGGISANRRKGKTRGHSESVKDCQFTPLCVGDMRALPVGGAMQTVSGTAKPGPKVGGLREL